MAELTQVGDRIGPITLHDVDGRPVKLATMLDRPLYQALNIRRIHWWKLLSPFTWWKYLKAAGGARQGRITDHPLQAPGLAIIDSDATVRLLYRGQTLGDYLPLEQVMTAAETVGEASPP